MAGDSSFDSVVLHLPFDGPNNGTDIRDRSNSRKTITLAGQTKLSTAQSAPLTGNTTSLFLDGTGDYLTLPYSTDIDLLSSDFTIEMWVYCQNLKAAGSRLIAIGGGTVGFNATTGIHLLVQLTPSGQLSIQGWSGSGTTNVGFTSTAVVSANTWTHLSVTKSGSNFYLSIAGAVESGTLAAVSPSTNPTLAVGTIPGEAGAVGTAFEGYIDDLRITKGVARYTSTFALPTDPNPIGLVTVTDTDYSSVSLLINGDGAAIADESPSPKTITAVGQAALTRVDSKVGAGSLIFDGAGDYLTVPASADFAFGTGNFTIEFWVNQKTRTASEYDSIFALDASATPFNTAMMLAAGAGVSGHSFLVSNTGKTAWAVNISLGALPSLNTWNHYAVVRSGNTFYVFINGAQVGTATSTQSINTLSTGLFIGYSATADSYLEGNLDSFRITKGVARYTSPFEPPNYVLYTPAASAVSVTPTQGVLSLNGQTPNFSSTVQLTPTQRQITVTGQTPGLPVPYSDTPAQRQISVTGQTPGLPTPYSATPAQRQLTLTGQTPTLYVVTTPVGNVQGRGFTQTVTITTLVANATTVAGRGFSTTPELYGGSVIEGTGFASIATITAVADQTAYVTGGGFASPASIVLDAQFNLTVTGRGFQTVPSILGAADIAGRSFKSSVSISAVAPTSFRVTGQTFASPATITAQAINSAVITGRGFVSGIAYSRIAGRGFATQPAIKSTFTAEYAEAFVMNLVQVTASERRNTMTYAVTRYQNYPFQHIAKIGANYYGFKSDGVYQLTGDYDTDAEVLVNGTILLNEDDLGAFNSQNIPYIYLNGDDDYAATAFVDDVQQPTFTSGFGGRRVKGARGSKGRYWYFKIEGIKKLQGVEYRPDSLSRKVK